MFTTTSEQEQSDMLLHTTKPLLHLTTAKEYPYFVSLLERYGRTVQDVDETDAVFARITDSAGTVHSVARMK